MKWSGILLAIFVLISVVLADGEVWEEDEKSVVVTRTVRGAKNAKGNANVNKQNATLDTNHTVSRHSGGNKRMKGQKSNAKWKNDENCRYDKGPWSECDPKTNMRSRTLTLKDSKKKDATTTQSSTCEPTKTITKKCKKACRYEKGTWSPCNAQNEMVRTDTLKEKSDASCEQKRQTTKKCKNKGARPNKANKGKKTKRPDATGSNKLEES